MLQIRLEQTFKVLSSCERRVDFGVVLILDRIDSVRVLRLKAILNQDCKCHFFIVLKDIEKALVRLLSSFEIAQHVHQRSLVLVKRSATTLDQLGDVCFLVCKVFDPR